MAVVLSGSSAVGVPPEPGLTVGICEALLRRPWQRHRGALEKSTGPAGPPTDPLGFHLNSFGWFGPRPLTIYSSAGIQVWTVHSNQNGGVLVRLESRDPIRSDHWHTLSKKGRTVQSDHLKKKQKTAKKTNKRGGRGARERGSGRELAN